MICREVEILGAKARTYVLSNYEAIDLNRRRAMIIICPGGAYKHCSEREAEAVAIRFNSFSYNALVLYYKTSEQYWDPSMTEFSGIWPKPQMQLAQTIRWVRENAVELNTDPDKIAVMGFSAGGHLAASLGVMWQKFGGQEIRPNAMVLCYPVITSGPKAHMRSIRDLIGLDDSLMDEVSLEKQVSKNSVPAFIWTTRTDQSVPYENSTMLKDALDRYNIQNELVVYESGLHGLSLGSKEVMPPTRDENLEVQNWPQRADAFLVKVFGSRF